MIKSSIWGDFFKFYSFYEVRQVEISDFMLFPSKRHFLVYILWLKLFSNLYTEYFVTLYCFSWYSYMKDSSKYRCLYRTITETHWLNSDDCNFINCVTFSTNWLHLRWICDFKGLNTYAITYIICLINLHYSVEIHFHVDMKESFFVNSSQKSQNVWTKSQKYIMHFVVVVGKCQFVTCLDIVLK